jgi:hypothetical protein
MAAGDMGAQESNGEAMGMKEHIEAGNDWPEGMKDKI